MGASEGNPTGAPSEAAEPTEGTEPGEAETQTDDEGEGETEETKADDKADNSDVKAQLKALQDQVKKAQADNAALLRQSRKHEERAKANATAAAELEQIRTKDLPEHEKALAEARKAGRVEATMEFGQKLARAEFRAATVGRLDDDKLSVLLDGLNLARFVDDEGDADRDAIVAYVDSILPPVVAQEEPAPPAPKRKSGQTTDESDIGQGAGRGAQPEALNGDGLQRALERAIGVRK